MAEWQTRRSQKPLRETSCGFDPHLGHQLLSVLLGGEQRRVVSVETHVLQIGRCAVRNAAVLFHLREHAKRASCPHLNSAHAAAVWSDKDFSPPRHGWLLSPDGCVSSGVFLFAARARRRGRCRDIARNDGPRVNGEITSRTCRLIGVDGSQLGLFGVRDALRMRRSRA